MKTLIVLIMMASVVYGECKLDEREITILKTRVTKDKLTIVRMVKKCVKNSARKDGTKNLKEKK
jgi:hypothetical protein